MPSLIILAEGATDRDRQPILSTTLKKACPVDRLFACPLKWCICSMQIRTSSRDVVRAVMAQILEDGGLKEDTRITCLGHVQRGGSPSAYDRILVRKSRNNKCIIACNCAIAFCCLSHLIAGIPLRCRSSSCSLRRRTGLLHPSSLTIRDMLFLHASLECA
jgi:hypothetical protein